MSKSIVQEVKNKVNKTKKENNMKTSTSNFWSKFWTITITLAAVAAFAFTFYQGSLYGASKENAKNAEIKSAALQLSTEVAATKK